MSRQRAYCDVLLCVQLQGNVLVEQEAQDEEGDDVREENPRGVRKTGTNQVSGIIIIIFLQCNLFMAQSCSSLMRLLLTSFVVSVSQLPRGDNRRFLRPDDSAVVHQRAWFRAWLDVSF